MVFTKINSSLTTTDYTGDLVLENGTRSRLLFDGGYMSLSDNAYHYFLTDHLGSVRVVANASGTAEEYDHYYPLGGPIAKYSTATSIQPVKYQGKEWGASKGLNLYDFGARRYDPATGRWLSQDPLAEKYYAHSPYLFCAANPMRFVDPEGKDVYYFDEAGNYKNKVEQRGKHRLAVSSFDTYGNQTISYYDFADPKNDPAAIDAGEITNLLFVREADILSILDSQNAFDLDLNLYGFVGASNSLGVDMDHNFDYTYSVLSDIYGGVYDGVETKSKYLFIPQGDKIAHNLMNFGNYLWGATGYTVGIPLPVLKVGAHLNSLGYFSSNNRSYNGYSPQLDSRDDQKSISAGVRHARKNNYRGKRK